MRWSVEGRITAAFVLAFAVFCAVGVGAYRTSAVLTDTAERVTRTRAMLDQFETVRSLLAGAERAQRGFVIFGEEPRIGEYRAGVTGLRAALRRLREMTAGMPGQQRRIDALDTLVERRLELLDQGIELRRTRGLKQVLRRLLADGGRDLTDEVGGVVGQMEREEAALLDRLAEDVGERAGSMAGVIWLACLLAAAFIAVSVVVIRRDLGERRRAEEALRVSEERTRMLIDTAHDAFVAIDAEGRITEWNRQAEKTFGWPRAEIMGRFLAETIVPPRYRDAHQRGLRHFPASGKRRLLNRHVEMTALRRDGSEFPVEVAAVPLATGATSFFTAFVRDLSERAEAAETGSRLAAIVEFSDDAVISQTPQGVVTSWNAGARRTYGYSAEEVVGRSISLLIPAERRDELPRILERIGRGESLEHYETVRVRKDGARIDVSLTVSPIRDSAGEITGVSVIGRDITERKRLEERMRKLNAELERRVAERTADLERSNEELRRFAYVASHDLQEPLRMVSSYTQLLAERYRDRLDADAGEFIGYAVEGAKNMQALIRDLLSFSQVTTRGKALEPVSCDAILDRTLDNLRLMIEESTAVVTRDPMPRVMGDATQLTQLFQNLIANAVKFRGGEPVRIHLGAALDGADWQFSVRDNGIGIEDKYRERIFVAFQRLHGRDQYPGTGIGLAICKKIVERHGGRIWVESVPGAGSTFFFTIPVAELALQAGEPAEPAC